MRYLIGILLIPIFVSPLSHACSIFKSPFFEDDRVSHNVDWFSEFPNVRAIAVLNPPSLEKTGIIVGADVPKAKWISKYASAAFSIVGAELPVSGFNEKGLTMAVLMMGLTEFPPASDPRPGLSPAQFVQYNLDLSSSIDEVVASADAVRPFSSFQMHFFVCDATHQCAVLQYLKGKLNVYRGQTLPYNMLTNSLYTESVEAADKCDEKFCNPFQFSLWRFAALKMNLPKFDRLNSYEKQSFGMLEDVAQHELSGMLTDFQVLHDLAGKRMTFKKGTSPNLAYIDVDLSNLDCREPRRVVEVTASSKGNLSNQWKPLTEELQLDMAKKMGIPDGVAEAYGSLPFSGVKCTLK